MVGLPLPAPGCASCAARDQVIAEQAAAIEELRADVVALAAEVRDLRRRLGRNSGNSSMPPSGDDLPGRTPPPAKPKRASRACAPQFRLTMQAGWRATRIVLLAAAGAGTRLRRDRPM